MASKIKQDKYSKNHSSVCKLTNKIGFASESAASKRVGGRYSEIVRYYKCSSVEDGGCGLYHLSSQPLAETIGRNVLPLDEQNRLLTLQNKELSAEIKKLKRLDNIDVTKLLQKRKKQLNFLVNFITEKSNLSQQERTELKTLVSKIE